MKSLALAVVMAFVLGAAGGAAAQQAPNSAPAPSQAPADKPAENKSTNIDVNIGGAARPSADAPAPAAPAQTETKSPDAKAQTRTDSSKDDVSALPRAASREQSTIFGLSPVTAVVIAAALLVVVILAIVAMTRQQRHVHRHQSRNLAGARSPERGGSRVRLCLVRDLAPRAAALGRRATLGLRSPCPNRHRLDLDEQLGTHQPAHDQERVRRIDPIAGSRPERPLPRAFMNPAMSSLRVRNVCSRTTSLIVQPAASTTARTLSSACLVWLHDVLAGHAPVGASCRPDRPRSPARRRGPPCRASTCRAADRIPWERRAQPRAALP